MYQVAALGVTLLISIFGGLFVGFIVSNCCPIDNQFDDEEHFREVEFDNPLENIPEKGKEVEDEIEPSAVN